MRRPSSGLLVPTSLLLLTAVVCPPIAQAEDPAGGDQKVDEKVVVTSTRLEDAEAPRNEVPASITILDRDQIESSGARNLQDLLAFEVGVALIDQVGNDVQKTLDLRGFAGGKGLAVFVDGARVNDPRNNAVALEQIPLSSVERIEITKGPAAALAGGGAEAGVIRVITRRGTTPGASLSAAAGTWNTQRYDGTYGGDFGRVDLFLGGTYDETDGFRANAGGRQTRLDAALGVDLGEARRLSLSALSSNLAYGNPGALTVAEFETDPGQNVFNQLDRTDDLTRQAALNFQGSVGGGFSLAANLAYRKQHVESLTTGRSASTFGGFFLDADGGTWSSVAQASKEVRSSRGSHLVAFGVEWLEGDSESTGFFTPSDSPGTYDPSAPSSQNTAGTRNTALFLQDSWTIGSRWTVSAGARGDRSDITYSETIPGTTPSDDKTFSELSFRAGAVFRPTESVDLYLSYADAFLPPTAEQLFAFPFFGSNPDLRPEDARSYEFGTRAHGRAGSIEGALFWTDTRDEIIYDPTPTPVDMFGHNVNANDTRRRGVELSARGRLGRGVTAFANASYTNAEFTAGANEGDEVPLVPNVRAAAGIDASLPKGFGIRADALHVGSQVLDNDAANDQARLDAYTVVNLRVGWERALGPAGARAGSLGIFVEALNAFDEQYATRGIYAFGEFVTPAPGRRYLAGLSWRM